VNLPKAKEYLHVRVQDTDVVWLAGANRFLQFKEPAYYVFEAWTRNIAPECIATDCSSRYDLPPKEAARFVREILGQLDRLVEQRARSMEHGAPASSYATVGEGRRANDTGLSAPFSIRICRLNNKIIIFQYGDHSLEAVFRPLFRQFEIKKEEETQVKDFGETITVFRENNRYYLRINQQSEQSFPDKDFEHFHGAVYMELLQILHGKMSCNWMGIFHASAVTDGKKALLFVAASGSGKSTLAALMMANGYRLVSDDFVPVALASPEVYPFPTAISVKRNARALLKTYFPSLGGEIPAKERYHRESFLPLAQESHELQPVPAAAILFVSYDPRVEYRLTKESNLIMMNELLKQSWIPGNSSSAGGFLKWYFHTPVYQLTYSDVQKAISGLSYLLAEK